MFWYVFQQRRLVGKTFVARVTFVGFVRLVTSGVRLKVGQLGEGLRAAYNNKRKNVGEEILSISSCDWTFLSNWAGTGLHLVDRLQRVDTLTLERSLREKKKVFEPSAVERLDFLSKIVI